MDETHRGGGGSATKDVQLVGKYGILDDEVRQDDARVAAGRIHAVILANEWKLIVHLDHETLWSFRDPPTWAGLPGGCCGLPRSLPQPARLCWRGGASLARPREPRPSRLAADHLADRGFRHLAGEARAGRPRSRARRRRLSRMGLRPLRSDCPRGLRGALRQGPDFVRVANRIAAAPRR